MGRAERQMKEFGEYINITLEELIFAFSNVLNLVDTRLYDHHKQVAYIAYEIAKELNLPEKEIKEVIMVGLIHDIGAFKQEEIDNIINFEDENVENHSIGGYLLLNTINSLSHMAEALRWHHRRWEYGKGFKGINTQTAMISQIIYLADRVSILIETIPKNILSKSEEILNTIEYEKDSKFNPELVDIFKKISNKPSFWINIVTQYKEPILKNVLNFKNSKVTYEEFMDISKLFIYSIDFRSRYTAAHSIGVAAVAERLSKLCGMSENDCKMMKIAGYFHDIGKLVIPVEILDKPSRLTKDEYDVIKQHTYYTYHILDNIKGMEKIRDIAAYHHETLDGKGYPFGINKHMLSNKSRLMAVADIFTALTEKRPYRESMKKDEVANILMNMVNKNKIEKNIVEIAIDNYEELYEYNKTNQSEAIKDFYSIQNRFDSDLKIINGFVVTSST
ncbi:HD domain-containing phosphohydrolase [Romboutsia sp.]|uniref:HD domain-containing phosphohydrolase n=1 Tax=Romboutsia sp. TaxID=1965302 RepID=UPI002D7F6803|nr:HD domain-containing phosphohydrolase [Romboutsia sp.]